MKKFLTLMVITGLLAATAPRAIAENAGGVQHPWYNPPYQQSVPEVPVVRAPAPGTHPAAAATGSTFFTGPVLIGIGAVLVGAVALAASGGGGGDSTPATTNH